MEGFSPFGLFGRSQQNDQREGETGEAGDVLRDEKASRPGGDLTDRELQELFSRAQDRVDKEAMADIEAIVQAREALEHEALEAEQE